MALFFRRRHGLAPGANVFFDGAPGELQRLVTHNDIRHDRTGREWHFTNPIAYDIASRIGGIVPRTRPARFFLNGELQGVYVLTEHVGPAFLASRFGHSDFDVQDSATDRRLLRWARELSPLTMARVNEFVDLENLTRWTLSILFCGTTDVWQGYAARDRRAPGGRWFWINWDMDHSFMDLYQRAPVPWEIDTYRTLLGEQDGRSVLVTRLLESDPAYRTYFLRMLGDMLNHRLTREFLQARLAHYRTMAAVHGVRETGFLDLIEAFFQQRASVIHRMTPKYIAGANALRVTVQAAEGVTLNVDGYLVPAPYRGTYYRGTPVVISVPEPHRGRFGGWRVNGQPAGAGPRLELTVAAETTIQAQFQP
jgi:hypothetical protein